MVALEKGDEEIMTSQNLIVLFLFRDRLQASQVSLGPGLGRAPEREADPGPTRTVIARGKKDKVGVMRKSL